MALGHDVAGEKQERKTEALEKIEAAQTVLMVGKLADEYFERMVLGKWEHPNIVRSRVEKNVRPHLGKLLPETVEPRPELICEDENWSDVGDCSASRVAQVTASPMRAATSASTSARPHRRT